MPPGPSRPRALQTLSFVRNPLGFLEDARRRYGDIVTFSTAFDQRFVMIFSPELLKQVFRGSPEQLRAGEANSLLGPVLGERSVLLLDGSEHLRQRKLMLPPFHGQRMRAYEQVMRDATDAEIDAWPVGSEFALMPSMQSLTLEVIMRAVFGVHEDARRAELKRRVRSMLEPISRPLGVLLLSFTSGRFGNRGAVQRFVERRAQVDELIYEEIALRRREHDLEERDDVFSMLLCARDEDGRPMTDSELRDELVTLLVAGHETTATGLAWTFDLLLHNPAVIERARQGDDAYVDALVKEALRIRPVIPGIGRVVRGEPFELGGYTIPPGVEINPSIVVMHRRPDLYPEPAAFRPERFLGPDAPDTYSWIPFGGGTRRCLGAAFAQFEMRVVVERVLERAALAPAAAKPEQVQRRGITLVPKTGVRVRQQRAPEPHLNPLRVAAASN